MVDREKVVKGLECCVEYFASKVKGVMFDEWLEESRKAIALLKAQEPRVMTLYEVAKMAADFQDSMLWFEPKEVDNDMWFMAYAQPMESGETDICIYEFGNDVPIKAKKYLYGKTWRCWTSRPTDEQREKVKWK